MIGPAWRNYGSPKITNLKGNIPGGKAHIDGFVAGSTPLNHERFMDFVSEPPDVEFWKKYLSLEPKDPKTRRDGGGNSFVDFSI